MGDINIISLVEHQSDHSPDENIDYLTRPGVESSRTSVNVPPWVPNYSVPPILEPLNNVPRTLKDKGRWKASGNLKWKPHQKSKDKTILTMQGFCQDEILERGATDIEIIQDHSMYTVLELLKNALDLTPSRASTEQLWRALVKDTFRGKAVGDEARRRFLYLILDPLRKLKIALSELKDEEEEEDSLKIAHLQDGRLDHRLVNTRRLDNGRNTKYH